MHIQLIPVIELKFSDEEHDKSKLRPESSYWLNNDEWHVYFEKQIEQSSYQINYKSILKGYPFYSTNQFQSKADLKKLIIGHLGDDSLEIKDSCGLFGGCVLVVNGVIKFTPQCCSLLSDFESWKTIVEDDFKEGYICPEAHPCPNIIRKKEELQFIFKNEWEDFIPPTIDVIVNRISLKKAIEECQIALNEFAKKLDELAPNFGMEQISDILIYEKY